MLARSLETSIVKTPRLKRSLTARSYFEDSRHQNVSFRLTTSPSTSTSPPPALPDVLIVHVYSFTKAMWCATPFDSFHRWQQLVRARRNVRVAQGARGGAAGPWTRVHFRWACGAERTTGVISAAEHLGGSAQGLLPRWAAVRQKQPAGSSFCLVQMCSCFDLHNNNNNNNDVLCSSKLVGFIANDSTDQIKQKEIFLKNKTKTKRIFGLCSKYLHWSWLFFIQWWG